MYQRIVLAGGTGFLGTVLRDYFRERCHELVILSRQALPDTGNIRYRRWDGVSIGDWCAELENAEMVINLSGRHVDCRYTAANRAEIFRSRLEPTDLIAKAIRSCKSAPGLWINLASATIYRHAEDRPQTEEDGDIGTGFSVDVCQAWERHFFEADTPGTRKVALRTSFVLGRHGGAFLALRRLVRLGLGGHQGSGRQMVSWLHELDFARIVAWLLEHPEQSGAFNVTAPEPLTNRDFMKQLRKAFSMPLGLPAPAWLLEPAAWLMRTETELLLKSRWVLPERLEKAGFRFSFPDVQTAINDLVATRV